MEDPFTKCLEICLRNTLSPELTLWNETKAAFSCSSTSNQFPALHSFIIQSILEDYNCRLLLKTVNIELHKNPSCFPSVFLEHYNTVESLGWIWRRWVVQVWPQLKEVSPPEIAINLELAEKIGPNLNSFLKVDKLVSKPKWRVAAFQFNAKNVLERSVKYLLEERGHEMTNPCGDCDEGHWHWWLRNKNWKVEVAMKPYTLNRSHIGNSKKEEKSESNALLAQCILRCCKMLNYSIEPNSEQETIDSNTLGCFVQIPDSVVIPAENILVSFTLKSSEKEDQVCMEFNSKDFCAQYSEAVVILYNYARINTILEKYDGHVKSEEYPELPCLEDVNFHLIGESKEEFPIIIMLFMWTRVKKSVINIRRRGKGYDKINLPFLFDFIKSLARAFDSFYNRNVVIVPQNAPHNFRSMFARLYLCKAIAVIFKEFIHLTGIEMD